ncbi:DNA primase [Thalassotalea sp. HSM 43]|uniref:DNA primase n=1 Tax=Thalassotalea sp. HSM 43 TaxID=2552945 RepID=UPI0010818C6F|nr:DNA primase [Thalassotalea sp. HSM 43]QBY03724.1 DNA primase [Thalassotalea sp. HSM 43]
MAGLIPRSFIDDLLARTDIVDLVESRVPLKKAGKNYQACCPFHSEKSPSFTVSRDKQFYHCFGCGAHGNAISFVMEYDRLEFVDAIEELAGFHGMEVEREQTHQSPAELKKAQLAHRQKQDDYELLGQISQFYQKNLRQHADSAMVIEYLKGRGLTGEVAKQFSIGYSADSWDDMMKVFGNASQSQKQLVDLGMAIQGDKNRPYDRFRGRLMFPIKDKRGRVIGFGGRVIQDGTPKYLNSPETRIYHKGQELYGLYEAKKYCKDLQRLVVVEGYMDVVALAQHGIPYAVASLGTSTSTEQLQTMFRTVKEVICCYDGDKAGRDAAWRAMENALPLVRDGISLKFVFVPDGEDPDTLIRQQGQQAFEKLLDTATPLSQFLFDHLMQQVDINSLEGKASLVETFQPYLQKLPDSVLKDSIVNELANKFGSGSQQQLERLNQNQARNVTKNAKKSTAKVTPVRLAIALLLEHPHLVNVLDDLSVLDRIEMPGIDLFKQLMQQCKQKPQMNSSQLIEMWRGTEQEKILSKLLMWEHHIDGDAAEHVFTDILEKLINSFVEKRTELLLQKARMGQLNSSEKQELQALINAQS